MQNPGALLPTAQPVGDYERNQRRKALYRVLAANIIRELRDAGYHGHDLLEFVSEVMQAITDNGWGQHVGRPVASVGLGRSLVALDATCDAFGRPTILGEKTILRPARACDRMVLQQWLEEPLVRNSLIPPVLRQTLAHLEDTRAVADRVDLVVCDRVNELPVGMVSLHDIDPTVNQAALAKMIGDPEYRGKGVAHEATQLILTYGFETLGLHRIYLKTLGGSLKNIKLNERLGFRFEGVLEDASVSEGRYADVILMGMLREEFRSGTSL